MVDVQPRHSYLCVLPIHELTSINITSLLQVGVKVIFFTQHESRQIPEEVRIFNESKLLELYLLKDEASFSRFHNFTITDGQHDQQSRAVLDDLARAVPMFNIEQYLVEHASIDDHLCVEAGAGTGKTTVMIQRILFLLHTANASLREIVMITFTREAAQNMFHKLRAEFYLRFKATRRVKYLTYIEDLRKMQISTIHSFARTLIRDLGSGLGYGQNMQIRSFKLERKKIIEDEINLLAEQWLRDGRLLDHFQNIPFYKIIDIIDSFWTEMERKSLTIEDISHIDWGEAPEISKSLHQLFGEIIIKCEQRIQSLKQDENSAALSDLTRQVELITRNADVIRAIRQPVSYLFVDEFQDTDDAQIKFTARLASALQLKIFAVGDIKQSIYRFRGADYTAFTNLREQLIQLGETLREPYQLRKNYRSAASLLTFMDAHFSTWGRRALLSYTEPLIGMKNNISSFRLESKSFTRYSNEIESYILKMISEAKETLKDPANEKVAVLVRTNGQAHRLKKWCDKAGIHCDLEIGGTFFTSEAVKEFAVLIEALLYPNRAASLANLLNSSYSEQVPHWTIIAGLEGNEEKVVTFLKQYLPFADWNEKFEQLRTKPVLSVAWDIVEQAKPAVRYYHRELESLKQQFPENQDNEQEAKTRALQYQKNLNHLMELIHEQFSTDFLTLYSIHNYLKLSMAVNRDEDEPLLSEEEKTGRIRIMTVHKSKGLEFHTVIMPFTDLEFRFERSELLLEKQPGSGWKTAWKLKEGDQVLESYSYNSLTAGETAEVIKEEARLLYVAMTRSEERLWIINNKKYSSKDTWSRLLSMQ